VVTDYDIVIAGGGMVGVSLALCLAETLPQERRILLVEGFPLPARDGNYAATYNPSFDARSTALSYSSYLIYRKLGIWDRLAPHSCPIERIHVSDRGRFGSAVMRATDYDWPALGYVIDNAWLGNILIQCFHENSRLQALSPARVVNARPAAGRITLSLEDGSSIDAGLLVVADGADSQIRQALGVATHERHYQQHALIANIGHAQPHSGCAFERFTDTGPLAMLPLLADPQAPHRSALVWSLPPARAEQLRDCSAEEFLAALQAAFGYRLGRLQDVGERTAYPLTLVQATEQVRHNVVVMGNAAHTLHPVAGQGFNLALRDVHCLGDILATAGSTGAIGELALLQRYEQAQALDQERTVVFSDRLPGLFMGRDPALGLLRDIGLAALDASPAVKREFVALTAGIAAIGGAAALGPTEGARGHTGASG
jgi:2-octaprenyl-6-methoxyphenol hydroxylase